MNLKRFLDDDAAVSPVIGVILMVAITVILAAVIGTFVMGLGENVQTTPQAKFDFDYNESGSALTVTHDGGDGVASDNVNITSSSGIDTSWTAAADGSSLEVTAGDSVTINDDDESDVNPDDTVRVVWSDPDTDKSATLGRWDGPDA